MAFATPVVLVLVLCVRSIEAHTQHTSYRALNIHNPGQVDVKEVHMVLSSHFDGGCKTPGCGLLVEGEPNLCAKVGPHWKVDPDHTGEPYNYHIINRYFDKFLYEAVDRAEQLRNSSTPYTYMTQSWVLALMFDCQNTGNEAPLFRHIQTIYQDYAHLAMMTFCQQQNVLFCRNENMARDGLLEEQSIPVEGCVALSEPNRHQGN